MKELTFNNMFSIIYPYVFKSNSKPYPKLNNSDEIKHRAYYCVGAVGQTCFSLVFQQSPDTFCPENT